MLIILTPGFPTDEQEDTCLPPVQQFLLSVLEFRPAHDITVVTMQYPFTRKPYHWHGIRVYPAGGANSKGWSRIATWLRTWRLLNECRKNKQVEGILGLWLTEASLIAQYYGMFHGIRRIFWMQGQDAKKENRYVRLVRPKPQQVLAISEFNSGELERNHGLRAFAIAENGIRPGAFPALNIDKRDIDIFAAGSLIPLKNYELLLEVVALLVPYRPDIRVLHAGEGPLAESLKDKARLLGLGQNIIFAGKTSHAEVLELMNRSRIFVHTSTYEGSSTVIAEALYSGCQVVSTIALNQKKISQLHLCGTPEKMADTILDLLQQEGLPERVTNHSMHDTAGFILDLFQSSSLR